VIHFAGLKSVNESIENPELYYQNNVKGSSILFEAMKESGVAKIVFSSSATVYGIPEYLPIDEAHPTKPINPYGLTKLDIENILLDLSISNPNWKIISLRYFNPVGAHPSGEIGEDPNGIPNNLMPYISKVASKELSKLKIFGDSYNTIDGTGVRDYIHVMDLADGHLAALKYINNQSACLETLNLGTGNGYSVIQILSAFEKANNIKIPYEICDPRPGDVDSCYAEIAKSINLLDWSPKRGIMEMCKSAWDYESKKKIN
jgi:UDP-glucose 4-epimerase